MKIKAFDERNSIEKELEASSITDLAKKMKVNLEEVIIIKNDELVTEESEIKDKDQIKFLSVISGG